MASVTRTRRGIRNGRRLYSEGLQGIARRKAARRIGRRGRKPQRTLTWSEITWGEGFGFRNRPSQRGTAS